MNKGLLIISLVLLVINAYSQIKFEKGYFIDNEGTKVEGLIKNHDWRKNPTEIEYKSDENSESKLLTAVSIKEFGVYSSSKYVITTVKIDRSSTQLGELSTSVNPIFKEERLFLKVLVEGKANLYYYSDANLKRFFYSIDESQIEPLIFKLYETAHNHTMENNRFRQQLWNSLKCSSIEMKKLENLNYDKRPLINVFTEYNKCSGSKLTTFEDKVERQVFAISVRPRLNYSSFGINNSTERNNNFDWGNTMEFGVGLEGEFFLPINKNKWSFLLEPTYQSFSGRATAGDYSTAASNFNAQVDYKSIQLSAGVRYYFFLNEKSQIFVNTSFAFDFPASSSKLEITRLSGYPVAHLEIGGEGYLAFGAGFKHKAFSIEGRCNTTRDLLNKYVSWESKYKTFSVVLGYSIFRKKS